MLDVVISLVATLTGTGFVLPPTSGSTPDNPNAPAPGAADLVAGNVTIQVPPSSFTVQGCLIIPPPGSTNAKTLKGASGDTGFGGGAWTAAPAMVPCVAGGTFVIVSAGSEQVLLVWF